MTQPTAADDVVPQQWPALVINLQHRQDRWTKVTANLAAHTTGFVKSVQRIDAIYDAANGARGCLQSFAMALETAWNHEWPEFFILEDDVVFHPNSEALWRSAYATLPEGWQALAGSASWLDSRLLVVVSPSVMRYAMFTGTHCVLYRRASIPLLLHTIRGHLAAEIVLPYDHVVNVSLVHKYLMAPFVAHVLDNDASDIRTTGPKATEARMDLEDCVLPTERAAVQTLQQLTESPLTATELQRRFQTHYVSRYVDTWPLVRDHRPTGEDFVFDVGSKE